MEREPAAAASPAPEAERPQPRRRSGRLTASRADEPEARLEEPRSGPEPRRRYSLRRGSSFTFLTPGPHWDFTLKRKRREKDDDVVSLSSLDLKNDKQLDIGYTYVIMQQNIEEMVNPE